MRLDDVSEAEEVEHVAHVGTHSRDLQTTLILADVLDLADEHAPAGGADVTDLGEIDDHLIDPLLQDGVDGLVHVERRRAVDITVERQDRDGFLRPDGLDIVLERPHAHLLWSNAMLVKQGSLQRRCEDGAAWRDATRRSRIERRAPRRRIPTPGSTRYGAAASTSSVRDA